MRSSLNERAEASGDAVAEPEIERGSFAPPGARLARAPDRLVVATFNIRYAVGSFLITGSLFRRVGIRRPGRRPSLVAGNVERAARAFTEGELMPPADLVALQEADRGTVRAGGRHVALELARAMRWHYAHASMRKPKDEPPKSKQWWLDFEEPLRMNEEGETGVALLGRAQMSEVERVELPWFECAWRPRLALAATLALGSGSVRVFNSHIDPHAKVEGQLAQHAAILARAEEHAGEPVVLLGDFNTLTPESRMATCRFLEEHGYTSPIPTGTPTWRAGLYRLHADWIFVRGLRVVRWGVARPLSVSDHWPVWAEIELERTEGAETQRTEA
ncbi:MAG TPA: endonuclease/exonuclease/phosphatase family protein [Pyrinomonadaceae bacterium]|jgi:endonuclease/exonuclease/phosphatase family metal-dependent hydrolase